MDGWTDVLVPPANSTLLPRANLAASENEKNTTEESGEDWRQRRGHRPAAGSRRRGGPAAVAFCKGEREREVRDRTGGRGEKERRAGRRVGPAAALRWPAGAGRRPWLPLPAKEREREVRNRTGGRGGKKERGHGGALFRRRDRKSVV